MIREKTQVNLAYEDVVEFDYWLCRDGRGRAIHKEDWQAIHTEFARDRLHAIEPFENVANHLSKLKEHFGIHLATTRLVEGHAATLAWLEKNEIPYEEIHFVKHRLKHTIDVRFTAAVDDDQVQAGLFAEAGVKAFMLAHPWNSIPTRNEIFRVSDWDALMTELLSLAE